MLAKRGAELSYHDPYVPALPDLELEHVPLEPAIDQADAVVLVTAHPGLDYADLAARASLFIDLRGITRGMQIENLVRL